MDPGVRLGQLPGLVSRVERLGHRQRHRLRHFPLRAEERVALHRLVQIRRDEREHVVVGRVRRAVRDPGNEPSGNTRIALPGFPTPRGRIAKLTSVVDSGRTKEREEKGEKKRVYCDSRACARARTILETLEKR